MAQVVGHPHPDHLFDAELAHFNTIQALNSVIAHLLSGDPGLAARVKAHDQFITADFLMLPQRSKSDLARTPISIIHALQIKKIL